MHPDEYPSFLVLTYTPPSKIGAHRRAQCHKSPCQPAGAGLDAYRDEGRDHSNSLISPHYSDKAGSTGMKPFSPLLFSEHMVTVGLGITSPDYFCHSWLGHACHFASDGGYQSDTQQVPVTSLVFCPQRKQKYSPPHPGFWVLQTRLLIHQVLLKSVRSRPQRDAPRTARPQHRRPPPPFCSGSASGMSWLLSRCQEGQQRGSKNTGAAGPSSRRTAVQPQESARSQQMQTEPVPAEETLLWAKHK